MRIDYFCFIIAAVAGITGICLGILMGLTEDHSLAPVHAHLNLLGWVTMTLYGLYHRGTGRPVTWLDRLQTGAAGVGVPAFAGGMAVYFRTADEAARTLTIVGALLTLTGMVLFLAILLRDCAAVTMLRRHPGPLAQS